MSNEHHTEIMAEDWTGTKKIISAYDEQISNKRKREEHARKVRESEVHSAFNPHNPYDPDNPTELRQPTWETRLVKMRLRNAAANKAYSPVVTTQMEYDVVAPSAFRNKDELNFYGKLVDDDDEAREHNERLNETLGRLQLNIKTAREQYNVFTRLNNL